MREKEMGLAVLSLTALLGGCVGPEAPDGALCQDVVTRVCHAPRCAEVESRYGVGEDCDQALLARTGCAQEGFAFPAGFRDRLLSCRLMLLREGDEAARHPGCDNVTDFLTLCPDVAGFLGGVAP
jgi:hypothetical protein